MDISILSKEKPSPFELKTYKKFSDRHWGKHYDSEEELKENFFDKPEAAILAYSNSVLVGLIYLFIRKIMLRKSWVIVGGIGGVVTHTKYRHKGIATKMLKKSLAVFKTKGIHVAFLSTDIPILGDLYRNVGFVPLGRPYYFISKSGVEKSEESGMAAPVISQEIFNQILSTKEKINVGQSNF